MKIGTIKESRQDENRVALSPSVCKQYIKNGFECIVESGAGINSFFSDEDYLAAGAKVLPTTKDVCEAVDILCKVNPPNETEIALLKEGSALVSFVYHLTNPSLVAAINQRKVSLLSMDAIPRISRAQTMDALSSQANLAGYKAVIVGANEAGKIMPMLMTAAGTIKPSKVVIFGAGVAGLQAIGTARRLGAVVEVTDIRPETKEEIESLGGKFISFEMGSGVKTEGGYVKEASEDVLSAQREILKKHLATADIAITTALIPGRKAPILLTEDMVKAMKLGSVIVDMAVEQGGNCELSEAGKVVVKHGVKIVGYMNYPSMLAQNSSDAYAKNIYAFLTHLTTKEGFKWDMNDEITSKTLICKGGEILR